MWNLLGKRQNMCSRLVGLLEDKGDVATLPASLQEHLGSCSACQAAMDDFLMSRALLGAVQSPALEPGPWFVPRVMAAISARDAELRRSLDTWSVLPKLAARLSWVSALALLLAGTWLYQKPISTPANPPDSTMESLLDTSQTPSVQDDILGSHLEREQ